MFWFYLDVDMDNVLAFSDEGIVGAYHNWCIVVDVNHCDLQLRGTSQATPILCLQGGIIDRTDSPVQLTAIHHQDFTSCCVHRKN